MPVTDGPSPSSWVWSGAGFGVVALGFSVPSPSLPCSPPPFFLGVERLFRSAGTGLRSCGRRRDPSARLGSRYGGDTGEGAGGVPAGPAWLPKRL